VASCKYPSPGVRGSIGLVPTDVVEHPKPLQVACMATGEHGVVKARNPNSSVIFQDPFAGYNPPNLKVKILSHALGPVPRFFGRGCGKSKRAFYVTFGITLQGYLKSIESTPTGLSGAMIREGSGSSPQSKAGDEPVAFLG